MPKRGSQKSFEEVVLAARAIEREQLGSALAAMRGPLPFGHVASEDEQDALWMVMDAAYQDDAAVLQLTLPPDQGGKGLTPLAASLVRWKNRADLMGVGVATIDEQIEYARKRTERCRERGVRVTIDHGPAGPSMQSVQQSAPTHGQARPSAPPPQMPPAPPNGGMMDPSMVPGMAGPQQDGMMIQPQSPGMEVTP